MKKLLFGFLFASIVFLSACNKVSTEDFEALEDQLELLETYDDTTLLADIAALEAIISDLEDDLGLLEEYDDKDLQAEITALEAEIDILEGYLALSGADFNNVPATLNVEYGETLDLLTLGITAVDSVDGIITDDITVNIPDTSILTIGEYDIIYTIVDSDGNTSTVSTSLNVYVIDNEYDFEIISEGSEIMITFYNYFSDDYIDVIIPDTIGGLPVVIIDNYAFSNRYI